LLWRRRVGIAVPKTALGVRLLLLLV